MNAWYNTLIMWIYDIAEMLVRLVMYPFSHISFKRESIVTILIFAVFFVGWLILDRLGEIHSKNNQIKDIYIIQK